MSNKYVVISGGLKQHFFKFKSLFMKKLQSLGRSLSKKEQKKIMGGDEGQCGSGCSGTCALICNGVATAGNCRFSQHHNKCNCAVACSGSGGDQ